MTEQLPRGRGHLGDQLERASTSIVLDLAEGAGKFAKPDERRHDLIAVGSTTESAAILDPCLRSKLVPPEVHSAGKAMLARMAARLVKPAKAQEDQREGKREEVLCVRTTTRSTHGVPSVRASPEGWSIVNMID